MVVRAVIQSLGEQSWNDELECVFLSFSIKKTGRLYAFVLVTLYECCQRMYCPFSRVVPQIHRDLQGGRVPIMCYWQAGDVFVGRLSLEIKLLDTKSKTYSGGRL